MTAPNRANHHLVRELPIPPMDSACGSTNLVGCKRSSGSRQPGHVPASILEVLRFSDQLDGTLDCFVATGGDRVRGVSGSSVPIHELRGVKRTKSEAIRQAFWGVGRFFIPFVLVVTAMGEMFESPRTAVVLFVATFVAARLAGKKLLQAYGLEFQAVSSGELRDRAFALAERGKAKLQQLYVLPTDHIRVANAFAHVGNNIFRPTIY